MRLPLEGVRIVEFGQLIAIPYALKLLGDMGAQIIRVESHKRLDNYRTHSLYENSADGRHWDRAANFYEQNRNKLSLTLDLINPACLDALRELVAISDIFAENFTPRVMRNFQLEYANLRQIKPDIIMVSSTGYGYTGPWADYGAIGYTTEATSGLAHITGYNDHHPALPEIPYADYTAAEHTAFAIMAALAHRARTGRGQFIDISQSETLTSTIPEAIMDYTVNGRTIERIGNQDASMSPHGTYPCAGKDRWLSIAVSNNNQWRALCQTLTEMLDAAGIDSTHVRTLAQDERYTDALSRWKLRNTLDEIIGAATAHCDQYALMTALQANGVPSGAVLDGEQLLFDPHLKARGFYEVAEHDPITGIPPLPYASRPWKFSRTPGGLRTAAPTLGRHNRSLLCDLMGIPSAQVDTLEASGAIGTAPPNPRPPHITPVAEQQRRGQIIRNDPEHRERLNKHYPTK